MQKKDTKLGEIINKEILANGPISISTYMSLCLTHPKYGYYNNPDIFGKGGDFITAPEISQMFGELIGLFIASTWQALGSPKKFALLELGPGRGTLMQDALRILKSVDGLLQSMQLNFLEISEPFRKIQRKNLSEYNLYFIENIDQLDRENIPLIIIGNEFFDALPIKQFQKQNGNWHERLIGLKKYDGGNYNRALGLSAETIPKDILPENIRNAKDLSVWELSLAGIGLMSQLSKKIAKRRGAILIIDYGYEKTQTGETFQAIKNHQYVDILESPGEIDLTAHVNFAALAKEAQKEKLIAHKLKTQGKFLLELGIEERAKTLIKANPSFVEEIISAKDRLINEEKMGKLFKVLCVSSKDLSPYPFI